MIKVSILYIALLVMLVFDADGQHKAMTFQEAEKQGIPFQHLDKFYKSAVHSDTDLAVFKTPEEQVKLQQAYVQYMQKLGTFLKTHKFSWGKEIRCVNRIYIQADGKIDYFLFNFPEGQLSADKEQEFNLLLTRFVQEYKFPVTAPENFAQCSAIKYADS